MAKTETQMVNINGTEITFYPNSHQYRINKKIIPSVTTILNMIDKSNQLLRWSEKLSREYLLHLVGETIEPDIIETAVTQWSLTRDKAGDIGHQVHEWISQFINAKINEIDIPQVNNDMCSEVINGIMGFVNWYHSHDVCFLMSEKIVYSKEHNYLGTFDVLMTVDSELILGDFKTGKSIYPETKLQLAAYHQALKEEHSDWFEVSKYMVLHFNKEDGSFETVEYEPSNEYFEHFNNLLKLKRFLAK